MLFVRLFLSWSRKSGGKNSLFTSNISSAMHRISARMQTVSVRESPNHRMTDFFMVTGKASFYRKFLALHVNSVQCGGHIRLSGQTPGAYHTSSQLITASRYLTETSRPIGEIADLLGDGDQSFFPAAFKKRYGVCPLAYRVKNAF